MSDDENDFFGGPDVGFRNGSIRLEEIPTVYYSGQTLNGSVVFDLKRPLSFTALHIQYVGEANVLWREMESTDEEELREVNYHGHEEYFNYTETLAGGFGVSQLPRTYQNFPFRFQIPFTAPSSFKGVKGSVVYTITAIMIYPDMTKEELKKEITVVAPLDLNTGSPRIKEPIDMEFEEVYSCCCSSAPVNIRIRLPVSGYCPGQVIPVAVEVKNESSIEITKMIFEIVSRELYRSRQPPSEFIIPEKVLVTTKRGSVLSNSKRNFTCEVLVPDMIAPYMENCSIIDIGYFFRVTIKLSGCTDELQDEAEICLGLVPVKETLDEFFSVYKHPMADYLPTVPIPNINSPAPSVPPVAPLGFTGSNTSIHSSQQNIARSVANKNHPPPYPGNMGSRSNSPYPGFVGSSGSINKSHHNIPQSTSYSDPPPPYPGIVRYPPENRGSVPNPNPYEIGFRVNPPYPTVMPPEGNNGNNIAPAPYPPGNIPSAPPAVD